MTAPQQQQEAPPRNALADPNRLAALDASGLLDSPPEEVFDRFTRLASRILGCPVSLVSLVTDTRQFFKSQVGLTPPWSETRETPLSHSFCQHVVTGNDVLRINDARTDARVRDNLAISELGVIAYLGVPIRTDDGLVLGSFCVIEGQPRAWSEAEVSLIEELARALASELRLRERTRTLLRVLEEKQNEEKLREQFLHMLVHDLRSPAAAIQTSLEMIDLEADASQDNLELLGIARKGVGDLLAMVNDLLDTHRIRAGKYDPEWSRVNLSSLLREAFQRTLPLAEAAGQTLLVHYPDGAVEIDADSTLLLRVLLNLTTNAVKYSGEGATIRIAVRFPKNCVLLEVADNGPGIPDDRKASIFDPFVTTGSAKTAKEALRSHGIGLAFCRLAMEAMGGEIHVEDAPGGGARFCATLPRTHSTLLVQ